MDWGLYRERNAVDRLVGRLKEYRRIATRYDKLTFTKAIEQKLGVMDLTALAMCMEHDLPLCVFDYKTAGNIRRVVAGERIGTLVTRA